MLSDRAIRAATREAHKAGKPVFVHPNHIDDVRAALRSEVDIIAHTTPRSGPWDHEIRGAIEQRHVALIPTLQLWKHFTRHDRRSVQDQLVNTAVGQLRAWLVSAGTVLFGTDLGAVDYDPTDEYVLMAAAGMSFRQILAALTTAPAAQFGESKHLGRIEAGLAADLTILRQDPSTNIRALSAVQYTLRSGKILYRAAGNVETCYPDT
jgi:imidazolonepropionase-like amidohydrolase